ncbi:hypothetical protein Tco_1358281 [Tanacetum coccineum]
MKPREEVYSPYKIQQYVKVDFEILWTHRFIEYHVEERNQSRHNRIFEDIYEVMGSSSTCRGFLNGNQKLSEEDQLDSSDACLSRYSESQEMDML